MAQEFEWDDDERTANITKHDVDFALVTRVFDGATLDRPDDRDEYGEERVIAFGQHEGVVYRVVYTLRGDVIRIISAQKASRHDRERYYKTVFS